MTDMQEPQYNRILVIDDEPGIRKMLDLELSAEGFVVFTAESGVSGIELFIKERPDLVMTDIKMPGMDGIEVLKHLKEMSSDVEVIVITGHGDMETAIQALQLDAGDFVTKPFVGESLSVAIKRARDRIRLKSELAEYHHELEAKVEKATQKLLETERLATIGRTVASVAHSVKNMLAGLRGGAYMVEQGALQKNERLSEQGLEMLNRNIKQVKSFVSDLLTLSKPREPEVSRENAYELMQEAVEIMKSDAESKGVRFSMSGHDQGLMVEVEKKALLDALMNLLSNAIDAASLVTSGFTVAAVERMNRTVIFKVEDNGPGLEKETKEKLFTGFFSTKGAAGTGLGLMVVKKTAEEHGGGIEFSTPPEGGAVFKIVLPIVDTVEHKNDHYAKR